MIQIVAVIRLDVDNPAQLEQVKGAIAETLENNFEAFQGGFGGNA